MSIDETNNLDKTLIVQNFHLNDKTRVLLLVHTLRVHTNKVNVKLNSIYLVFNLLILVSENSNKDIHTTYTTYVYKCFVCYCSK